MRLLHLLVLLVCFVFVLEAAAGGQQQKHSKRGALLKGARKRGRGAKLRERGALKKRNPTDGPNRFKNFKDLPKDVADELGEDAEEFKKFGQKFKKNWDKNKVKEKARKFKANLQKLRKRQAAFKARKGKDKPKFKIGVTKFTHYDVDELKKLMQPLDLEPPKMKAAKPWSDAKKKRLEAKRNKLRAQRLKNKQKGKNGKQQQPNKGKGKGNQKPAPKPNHNNNKNNNNNNNNNKHKGKNQQANGNEKAEPKPQPNGGQEAKEQSKPKPRPPTDDANFAKDEQRPGELKEKPKTEGASKEETANEQAVPPTNAEEDGDGGDDVGEVKDDAIPKAFSWLEQGKVTDVKTQGKCMSCWTFATNAMLEGAYAVKHDDFLDLSEQQMDCVYQRSVCLSGWPENALAFAKTNGIGYEADAPYSDQGNGTCQKIKPQVRVKEFYSLLPFNMDEVKTEIMNSGPVSFGMYLTENFVAYGGGIFTEQCTKDMTILGGHAMAIVGWGEELDTETNETIPYWIVKNSWGNEWGEDGYIRVQAGVDLCSMESRYLFSAEITDDKAEDRAEDDIEDPENEKDDDDADDAAEK